MKNGLSQEELAQICAVLKDAPAVDKAVLFGSRAMGLARSNSDIDIMLYGDKLKLQDIMRINSLLDDTTLPYQFDLIRHDTKNTDLLEHVKQFGVVIYERGKAGFSESGGGGKRCEWGDLISLEYGKPVSDKELTNGMYPVFGTNGQIGTSNLPPLCKYASLVLGRKGAYRGVHYSDKPFSVIDTAFYVKSKTDELDLKWAYYKFLTYDINRMDSGSAIPSTDRYEIYSISLDLPPLPVQRAIVATLSALDDKIAINTKINHHLEQTAQAIWIERFSENVPNGVLGDVIELFDSKRVPLSSNQRTKMEKIYPYYGAAALMDHVDNYLFNGVYLLLGEDGTVIDDLGYPILQYVWGKFWVNNHAHVIQGQNGFTVESLYVLLKQTSVKSLVTGAVQPKINQANLKTLEVYIPDGSDLDKYNSVIAPMFAQIRTNYEENARLADLRDTLLPRLMSGELEIKI